MKQKKVEVDAQLRDLEHELAVEKGSLVKMEIEWKGISTQKWEIESSRSEMIGKIVKLEANIELLTQQINSKNEVRRLCTSFFFLLAFYLFCDSVV